MAARQNASGSPDGEPEYLVVGFLRRPHGVHGEIIMDLHTDFPERLKKGRELFIGEKHKLARLDGLRPHQSSLLVKFDGMDSPEDVGRFRNQWVYIKSSDAAPLPPEKLYQHQLFGLEVQEENEVSLGKLVEVIKTGANDVYVVKNESGREVLLPAIPSVILEIDQDRRIMRVHLLEGLI